MNHSSDRKPAGSIQPRARRRTLLVFLVASLLLVLLLPWGIAEYKARKEKAIMREARLFFNKSDYRSAALLARQALQLNPAQVEASRLMAEIADRSGSIEATLWRRRVAELEPNLANLLLWAGTGLRLSELAATDQALSQVRPADRQTADYHQMAAALAIAAKQPALAEIHFAQALQTQPANKLHQLNLAMVRLQSQRPEMVKQAAEILGSLRAEREFKIPALRALLGHAFRQADKTVIRNLASELKAAAGAQLSDRLLVLEALRRLEDPEFVTGLQEVKTAFKNDALSVFELLSWLNEHGLAREAFSWANTLSPDLKVQLPVPLAMADALARQGQWEPLRLFVSSGSWNLWDFMRVAWLARVDREQEKLRDARNQWERAVRLTRGDPQLVSLLARTASSWQWEHEAEELWWLVAKSRSGQRPALFILSRLYFQRKDTRKLLQVAERFYALDPENPINRNNLAALSFLLQKNNDLAHQSAGINYRAYPTNAPFASTYAYSLYLRGQRAEALKILNSFPETEYQAPAMALYYGLILERNGQKEKAAYFLKKASEDGTLLPEEQALLEDAQKNLKDPAAA